MIHQRFKKILRATAFFTLILFGADSVCWSTSVSQLGTELGSGQVAPGGEKDAAQIPLTFPNQFGSIEKTFKGRTDFPIVYIQDAHASLEAQENIARIIDYFVREHKIKKVYAEGFQGESHLDILYPFKDKTLKKKTSFFFLDYLRLNGAEYAFVNRDHDFKLIGIELTPEYLENLKWYEKGARNQEIIRQDFEKIQKELKPLADKFYPRQFKEWLKLKSRFEEKQISLADYIFRSFKIYSGPVNAYPHLSFIAHSMDSKELTRGQKEKYDLMLKQMNAKTLFGELDRLEKDFTAKYLTSEEARQIYHHQQGISLLEKLNQFRITPEELAKLETEFGDLKTRPIAQFIANKRKRSIVLSDTWEWFIHNQKKFYAAASVREEDFKKHLVLDEAAVLVTGGFHQHGMTDYLEKKGVSYILIIPRITQSDPEHEKRYDFLMSGQNYSFEKNLHPESAAIPPMTQPVQYALGAKNLPQMIESVFLSFEKGEGSLPAVAGVRVIPEPSIVGSSLGAKEALQQKIWDAFETLKSGETRDIGSVEELVLMSHGRLQHRFPIPGRQILGRMKGIGSGYQLKTVNLLIEKELDGTLILKFQYENKKGRIGDFIMRWNEEKKEYQMIGSGLQWKIWKAFKTLKEGEREVIGSIEELIDLTSARMSMEFPAPDGNMVGTKRISIGAIHNLKKINLVIEKEKDGGFILKFQYSGQNEKTGECIVKWDGGEKKYESRSAKVGEYRPLGSTLQWRIQRVFESIKPGEVQEIGSVEDLVDMSHGQLMRRFPIPGGGTLGKPKSFGVGYGSKSVNLLIERELDESLILKFQFVDKNGASGESIVRWDEKKNDYEVMGSGLQWRIWKAFDGLKAEQEQEIGAVEALMDLSMGRLLTNFPVPNRARLGKLQSFGVVTKLEFVNLKMKKDITGSVYLEFKYESESRKSGITYITWDEKSKSYIPYTPESARPDMLVLEEDEKGVEVSAKSMGTFQPDGKAHASIEQFPMDNKLRAVPGRIDSLAYLKEPEITGLPKPKVEAKHKDKDVTVVIQNQKILLIFEGHAKVGTNIKDYPIVYQSPESVAEDKNFEKEVRQVLKDVFKEDLLFFATRYNMDIRALIWGIIGQKLKGKYNRKRIEELINKAILAMIDKSVEEGGAGEAELIPLPAGGAAKPEEAPKPVEETGIQLSAITAISAELEKRIEEIKDAGLKAMMKNQAINFIRKLEEAYFFKKFYSPDPTKDLLEHISEGIKKDSKEIAKSPLAKEALKLLQEEVVNALILDEGFHQKGLLNANTHLNLYQLMGIMRIMEKEKVVLADEMGLGKTLETISTFLISEEPEMLVIAPKLALNRWQEDLARHTDTQIQLVILANERPLQVLEANEKIQATIIVKPADRIQYLFSERAPPPLGIRRIVLINYELMPSIYDHQIQYRKEHGDKVPVPTIKTPFLALDEAHLLKNRTAKTSKAVFGEEIKKKGGERLPVEGAIDAKWKVLATGTPLENVVKEILEYMKYLALKKEGEVTSNEEDAKAEKLITDLPVQNLVSTFRETNLPNLSLLYNYLSQRMIRRLKADVVTGLPRKRMMTAMVNPATGEMRLMEDDRVIESAKLEGNYQPQLALYQKALSHPKDFEREMVDKLPPLTEDEEDEIPEDMSGARQLIRLEQAALNPAIFEENADSIKFDAALKLIRERIKAGKFVTIFTFYKTASRAFRKLLEKEFGAEKISYVEGGMPDGAKQKEIDRFQNKESQIMIATTSTMSLAIELTQADSIFFLNYPWKPSVMNQAIDRAHRLDAKRNYPGKELEIISLEMEHGTSIDTLKRDVLRRKEILAQMIVDGNLSPEILEAFIESDKKIMEAIEAGQAEDVKWDDYEHSLLTQFRLATGRLTATGDPALWSTVSEMYSRVLEHQGTFFANEASLDYLAGDQFPELKGRLLDVLDLASGPSTLYRAYEKMQAGLKSRNFAIDVTDYDPSLNQLRHGKFREGKQIQGSFESLSQFQPDGNVFDMINLSFAFYESKHPADLVKNVHRLLKDSGLFVLILMEGTVIPPRFNDALRAAGFDLKTVEGDKLRSQLDDDTYQKLVREYGDEFAGDVKRYSKRTFTYLVARKTKPARSELSDEDFRLAQKPESLDPDKMKRLLNSKGTKRIIPEDVTVEGKVIHVAQAIEQNLLPSPSPSSKSAAEVKIPEEKKTSRSYRGMRKVIGNISQLSEKFGQLERKSGKKGVDESNRIAKVTQQIVDATTDLKTRIAKNPKDISAEERELLVGEIEALKERNYVKLWFKDERLTELNQIITDLRATGSSLGEGLSFPRRRESSVSGSSLGAKEVLQQKIWDAFDTLGEGESADIGPVNELIQMTRGQLQAIFPIPGGAKIGKQWSFGAGENLKEVRLEMKRDSSGPVYLEFAYQNESGKSDVARITWNEASKSYIPYIPESARPDMLVLDEEEEDGEPVDASSLGAKEVLQKKIWDAFDTLPPGASIEIGPIEELIYLAQGHLVWVFPTPNREKLGKIQGFGGGTDLKSVNLKMIREENGQFLLIFRNQNQEGKQESSVVRWDEINKKYELIGSLAEWEISRAFKNIQPGETIEIEDIRSLVRPSTGALNPYFPQPDGTTLKRSKSIGLGKDLKAVRLVIKKDIEEKLILEFYYQKKTNKDFETTPIKLAWNGSEYVTLEKALAEKVKAGFEKVMSEGGKVEVGDISPLIQLSSGNLLTTFPTPGGETVGKLRSFGAMENLKSVSLIIEKEIDGEIILKFSYENEKGQTGEGLLLWDEKKQVYLNTRKKQQEKIWDAFENLKPGGQFEIGTVDELIQMPYGKTQLSFPIPGPGRKVIGKGQGIGAITKLISINLVIKQDESGSIYLEFTYQNESGKSGITHVTWDEKSKFYIPYIPESERPDMFVLEEGGETPTEGASLGSHGFMVQISEFRAIMAQMSTNPIPATFDIREWDAFDEDIQDEIIKHLLEKHIKLVVTGVAQGAALPAEFKQMSGLVQLVPGALTEETMTNLAGFLGKAKVIHISERLASSRVITEHLNDAQSGKMIFIQPHNQKGVVTAAITLASGAFGGRGSNQRDASGFWIPDDFGQFLIGLSADFLKHQILARAA